MPHPEDTPASTDAPAVAPAAPQNALQAALQAALGATPPDAVAPPPAAPPARQPGRRAAAPQRAARPERAQRGPRGTPGDASAGASTANPAPRERKVHPALEKLYELYPKLFGARFLPLKLGVYEELLQRHGDVFKKEDLKLALGLHARSTRYLEAVASGLPRHDLAGEPVEPVAPEHVHHAIMEVFKRRLRRDGADATDLRTRVLARLVTAIEASGLARDEYALRVRPADDDARALLDEALAEAARRAARDEALLRAFEASGKSQAEFGDMYGLASRDVAQTLARARRAGAAAAAPAAAHDTPGETPVAPDE